MPAMNGSSQRPKEAYGKTVQIFATLSTISPRKKPERHPCPSQRQRSFKHGTYTHTGVHIHFLWFLFGVGWELGTVRESVLSGRIIQCVKKY